MDYKALAESVIEGIGGAGNVANISHCATRLRFTLKDEGIADEKAVKAVPGVLGVARGGGQFQVIIGPAVPKAFEAVQTCLDASGIKTASAAAASSEADGEKKHGLDLVFDFLASVFTPILPAIIGAGLIKSFLAAAVLLGLDSTSTTYTFVNLIGDAPLYFLPILLAITTSKKLKVNTFITVAIAGALVHPSYTAMITDAFNLHFTTLFGLPVTLATYSASVIPVLLMVFALKYIDGFFDRVIPDIVKFFFKPVLDMLVTATLTFVALGPLGFLAGTAICTGLNAISSVAGWIVPTIVGGCMPLMVMAGMHYGLVPFMLQSIAANGYEQISGPGSLPSNIAQGAASLAVSLRSKDPALKKTAATTGITALLGVTEPALFGVTLKFKKVLASVMVGGAAGGLYAGITGVKCFSFCSPGLLALVAYIGPNGWTNLINAVISIVIGFVVTFGLVWAWGYKDLETTEAVEEERDLEKALA